MKFRLRHGHWFQSLLFLALAIISVAILDYNRQGISDALRLRNYKPSAIVLQLVKDDSMTPKARDIFYVNQPIVTAKADFTKNCKGNDEQAVVLGCYHGNQQGIYILGVTDPRLNGVEQVTAAHEMLHAAYDRLSQKQKTVIDGLLLNFYTNGLKDATVKEQIDAYKKTEPGDVINEMHSIFATEIRDLPANLESYYSQYMLDRSKIIDQYDKYQQEFTGRQDKIKSDDKQLAQLKDDIDTESDALASQLSDLQGQRTALNNLKTSGDIAAYNAAVPAYNVKVSDYNTRADNLRSKIALYNNLVQERNQLAAETNQLTAEISNKVPVAAGN